MEASHALAAGALDSALMGMATLSPRRSLEDRLEIEALEAAGEHLMSRTG